MNQHTHFSLSDEPIDIGVISAGMCDHSAGAVVTFDGRVRDHNAGNRVAALEYQAYPALAVATGNGILEEEVARHGILRALAVHRTGPIAIGESAVWVGVASEHRKAAFSAAEAIMERLKYELPVWKKETYLDGSIEWVGPDNKSAATGRPREDLPEWKAIVEEIWISPGNDFRGHHGQARGEHGVTAVEEVECVAGMGLKGDRYFGYKTDFKGQVTFFDAEVVEAVRREFNQPALSSSEFRRNIIVRGVRLGDWIGKHFRFQGVEFVGSEECKPCYWMDEAVAPGTEEFLKSGCRGGLRARILSDGKLETRRI
jgi:molybdopterin synthase catalytic subunit